ncbi:unnamed protein product [Durusdinium trenchii]|uniref:Uncharacterized protein n=1 Tax=Durusdinium trenchii TaxID=1381693 RepID=A0ABP0HK02_9DINO
MFPPKRSSFRNPNDASCALGLWILLVVAFIAFVAMTLRSFWEDVQRPTRESVSNERLQMPTVRLDVCELKVFQRSLNYSLLEHLLLERELEFLMPNGTEPAATLLGCCFCQFLVEDGEGEHSALPPVVLAAAGADPQRAAAAELQLCEWLVHPTLLGECKPSCLAETGELPQDLCPLPCEEPHHNRAFAGGIGEVVGLAGRALRRTP